jgi:DNA replication ATP-dependent helicase Dna2
VPKLSKSVLSQYLAKGCQRNLYIALHKGQWKQKGLPEQWVKRPGLNLLTEAGNQWEAAALQQLTTVFGAHVKGTTKPGPGGPIYQTTPLSSMAANLVAGDFVPQATFQTDGRFFDKIGDPTSAAQHGLQISDWRPDLLEVQPPGTTKECVTPAGKRMPLPDNDARLVLRVIDIKLNVEPMPGHFAEIVLYSIALANWIEQNNLTSSFVVSPEPAIWSGSGAGTTWGTTPFASLTSTSAHAAFNAMLHIADFAAYAGRVREFLERELPAVLAEPNWQNLQWHVHGACRNCEYLGPDSTAHPDFDPQCNHGELCLIKAGQQDHLSRVAFVSRGARRSLEGRGIQTVAALAASSSTTPALQTHQELLATRNVLPDRAQALQVGGQAYIPAAAGTTVDVPRWPDLFIYLSTDYDPSTRISGHFTYSGFFSDGQAAAPISRRTYIVQQKTEQAELQAFEAFLDALEAELQSCQARLATATIQVYIWDPQQHEHLKRVITRHFARLLGGNRLRKLSWALPPDQRIPNADIESTKNPILVVKDPVRALLAAPVPHYYKLEEVALTFRPAGSTFNYAPRRKWDDPLSDSIPPERLMELWKNPPGSVDRNLYEQDLERVLHFRHQALSLVVRQLYRSLAGQLRSKPPRLSDLRRPQNQTDWADLTRALYWYEELESSLADLENERVHAMPPEEREARLHSVIITERLTGQAANDALAGFGLLSQANRRVFKTHVNSRQSRIEPRKGFVMLNPNPMAPGMRGLRNHRIGVGNGYLPASLTSGLPPWYYGMRMEALLEGRVVAFDRLRDTLVFDEDTYHSQTHPGLQLSSLEAQGLVTGLDAGATIDPVHKDFLCKKLQHLFNAIQRPPLATTDARLRIALGLSPQTNEAANRPTNPNLAELLWNAPALSQLNHTPWAGYAPTNYAGAAALNASQRAAWQRALQRRLTLIWGPPGTGKTRTLAHVVAAYAQDAIRSGAAARILVTANTYTAIDNLLEEAHLLLSSQGYSGALWRVRSTTEERNTALPHSADIEPKSNGAALRAALQSGVHIVGGTPQQLHNLMVAGPGGVLNPTWNLAIVDEASQITVAQAALSLSALAPGFAVIVAGDHQQLDPIRLAQTPTGLEHVVGSFLDYLKDGSQVTFAPLLTNYRSNSAIVALQQRAGYPPGLTAHSPDLQLRFTHHLATQPTAWPTTLTWTPAWTQLLDPSVRVACFTYEDTMSSHWNDFEAHAVAALVRSMAEDQPRLCRQLDNELDATNQPKPQGGAPYDWPRFWQKGIGIVTPHRAQRSLVVSKLMEAFQHEITNGAFDPTLIQDAVDTVERFQGQERDVILVSYAVGDPDLVLREDDFLLSFNRFNVASSRARVKLIVFVSNGVAFHLSQDLAVVQESRLLKEFIEDVCTTSSPLTLPGSPGSSPVTGTLRSA